MSSEQDARQAPETAEGPAPQAHTAHEALASPAPAEPSETLKLTDPKGMRALAHPMRLALLELFSVHETLTATQASELLGESPANCAFHLRTLGKYGYLREAGGGRGRERPWVAAHQTISISTRDQEPQAELAARSLSRLWRERILDRIRRAYDSARPAGWEHAPESSAAVLYLTIEETAQVAQEMHQILDRYKDRRHDPSLRPDGAVPVEYAFFGYPRADLIEPAADKETGQ